MTGNSARADQLGLTETEQTMVSEHGERHLANDREKSRSGGSRIEEDDRSVPVGNAPVATRWPLFLMVIAWLGWVAFLVAINLSNYRSPMS